MPRRVDHEARRREFAAAVWKLIAQRGIEGVTLRSVATAAGVSAGRVQHYYASREELIRDSCRTMIDLAAEQFGARTGELPAAEQIRALVLHPVPTSDAFTRGTAIWIAYLAKSVDDPGIGELIAGAQRGTARLLAGLISTARAQGAMNPAGPPAAELAAELLALADGYATRVLTGALPAPEAIAALSRRLEHAGITGASSAPQVPDHGEQPRNPGKPERR